MIAWGGHAQAGAVPGDGAAYDPATDAWRVIPNGLPAGTASSSGVWGHRVLMFAARRGKAGLAGAAYDPEAIAWSRLADGPGYFTGAYAPSASPGDPGVFLWSGRAALYVPGG